MSRSAAHEVLTEMTDAIGSVFLGMTVGCARCHDHKFDAFSQEDYYACKRSSPRRRKQHRAGRCQDAGDSGRKRPRKSRPKLKGLRGRIAKADGPAKEELQKKLHEIEHRLPPPLPAICTVHDVETEQMEIYVLKRGLAGEEGQARRGRLSVGAGR